MTEDKWEGFRKPNFGPPPAGYIAGYGRGATGFITRSDIGPAKMAENPFMNQKQEDDANYNDAKYDEWSGYSAPLFTAHQMDDEDREAEQAYNKVDEHMDGRRREERQKLVREEMKKMGKEKPSISQQFSDLKRQLVKVSYDDWLNLPDSADSSLKKQKRDRYVPVPDMLIANLVNTNKLANEEVAGNSVNDFGQAKGIILQSKLDRASEKVPNKTIVDKTGYLTSLNSFRANDETYLGDLKKARLLLKSAITTNPKNPETWVSAARVEELDGKLHQARVIINQGLEHCPHSEDLWVEASRLEKPDVGRNLLAKAVSLLPKSEKLWLVASRLQTDKLLKRRILRKGLEHNTSSVRLWKELIDEEQPSEAKSLLYKAVQCLPNEISLWLALAKLENYENAKSVLNKARKANPLEPQIWISAAKLQETQSESKQTIIGKIKAILSKAQQVLVKNGSTIKRGDWLQQAALCEKTDSLMTCEMLVEICCGQQIQPAQLESTIDKEATSFAECNAIHTARFMYRWGITHLHSKLLLQKAIVFQRNQNNEQQLDAVLKLAVEKFGDSQQFWLAIASKYLSAGDYASALQLLDRGLQGALYKEPLLLKKVAILQDLRELKQAEELLSEAREKYGLSSWVASVELYIKLGNFNEAWRLCQIIYKKEKREEVFVLAYTVQKKVGRYEDCRSILEKGVETFEKSIKLWLLLIDHELSSGFPAKARMMIERAKVKNPKTPELHEAAVRLELATNNPKGAVFSLAKGLSECPKSGLLWSLAVEIEPRANRKKKASEAMSACPDDPNVNLSVAKIFWKQKKLDKAKKWFEKTIELRPVHGDAWCYFYKFLLENQAELALAVLNRLKSQDISEGRLWLQVVSSEQGWTLSRQDIIKRVLSQIDREMSEIE